MNNPALNPQRLAKNALILALIITVIKLTMFGFNFISVPRMLVTTVYTIFPHAVFGYIQRLILLPLRSSTLIEFPLFALILSVLFFVAAQNLQKEGRSFLLKLCYVLLIISICLDIPFTIQNYFIAVKEYEKYQGFVHRNSNGILGLIDDFTGMQKPSMILLILDLAVMLGYLLWSGFQISQIRKYEKQKLSEISNNNSVIA